MALAFDFMGIACSEIADISERRTERMVNAALSNGLTPFLTTEAVSLRLHDRAVLGSFDGFGEQGAGTSGPGRLHPILCKPGDMVSMGTAARKSGWIVQNTLSVLADELLTACQAMSTSAADSTPTVRASLRFIRGIDRVRKDIAF